MSLLRIYDSKIERHQRIAMVELFSEEDMTLLNDLLYLKVTGFGKVMLSENDLPIENYENWTIRRYWY